MNVVILYDAGADDWTAADIRGVRESVDAVAEALQRGGHTVSRMPVSRDRRWVGTLAGADLVFNLCESVDGLSSLEYQVTALVELWGVPCTGTSSWTTAICHRKPLLNAFLHARGLPVPAWREVDGDVVPDDVPLPAIVKPAAEDASVGIDQGAVVKTRRALAARVRAMQQQFNRVVVQRYVAGREFNVGFVGDDVLPISEIDFRDMPEGTWPIVSFAAKWDPGSPEDRGTQPVCPAPVDEALAGELLRIARAAWAAVEGHGYGRVDMRVDPSGAPWILEVNPCPDASPDAGLANMAQAAGWSYDELILRIVDAALPSVRYAETST